MKALDRTEGLEARLEVIEARVARIEDVLGAKVPAEPKQEPDDDDTSPRLRPLLEPEEWIGPIELSGDRRSVHATFADGGRAFWIRDCLDSQEMADHQDPDALFPWVSKMHAADVATMRGQRGLPWSEGPDDPGGGGISADVWWSRGSGSIKRWQYEHMMGRPLPIPPPGQVWPVPWTLVRQGNQPGGLPGWFIDGRDGYDGAHYSRAYRPIAFLARTGCRVSRYFLWRMAEEVAARWGIHTEEGDPKYRPEHLSNPAVSPWWYLDWPDGDPRVGREWFHSVNLLRLLEQAGCRVPRRWKTRLRLVASNAERRYGNGVVHFVPEGAPDPPQIAARAAGLRGTVTRGWEEIMCASRFPYLGLIDEFERAKQTTREQLERLGHVPDVYLSANPLKGTGGGGITRLHLPAIGIERYSPAATAEDLLVHAATGGNGGQPLTMLDWHPLDWVQDETMAELESAAKEARR